MDILGYAASCAVLATFLTQTMKPLRLIAILSNVLFLSYGYLQHIYPVFFLHLVLLPINSWRLLALHYGQCARSYVLQPASAAAIGSRSFIPWLVVGLLAGLLGPFTAFTAMAEPTSVRELADHLIIECQSTANAVAVRLTGKSHSKTYGKSRGLIPDQSPERLLVHTSEYRT
jgi:hypothetical protein